MKGINFRNTLIEMGHPQPPTPVATDNTTVVVIIHDTIKKSYVKNNGHAFSLNT